MVQSVVTIVFFFLLAFFSIFRQLTGGLCQHHKKPLFHSCFQLVVLLCLVVFVFCYFLSGSSFSPHEHYQTLINRINKVIIRPPHLAPPKVRTAQNHFQQTTEKPPSPSTAAPSVHTTLPVLPTSADPTVAATVPSSALPAVSLPGIEYHLAYAPNYHFIMDNTELCKNQTPFLVLMVPVAPHNVEARNAIRQTWANKSVVQGEVVLTLFMLGLAGKDDAEQMHKLITEENLQHRDLIQSDFLDTYLNLTIKTMVIMDWLATHCPTAAYAMKVDSDMFLNIDNLVLMLQKPEVPKKEYLTGYLMVNRPVVRSKGSKWYVSEELFPQPTYPTYTLGMGYIFSNDLPGRFVEASKSISPFNIEDAYIGMCMKKLGLSPKSPPDPSQFKAYNYKYDRCEYSKIITYILGSAKELLEYWTDLKKPGAPC